ncbi:MAG: DUF1365 family protein [Hyphomicrobiales bacterium]|nr:DUF1365 family protein [Hyphomicrobiales bacterium]
MTALDPAAPVAAASLYRGKVMHARLQPVGHRFSYRVANLLIDIDRLDEAGRQSRFFSVGRPNLMAFYPEDHAPHHEGQLRAAIDAMLGSAGLVADRVLLLCYPRIVGFVFNPLSVYYCFSGGELVALIYEVRNTFGEFHSYIAPVAPGSSANTGIRQTCAKRFYVSPFMDMDLHYHFRLKVPARRLTLRILETSGATPVFAASFSAAQYPLDSQQILRVFFALPMMTLKVVAAIHWEALRLWLKGMRLRGRPSPPAPTSLV